MTLPAEARDRLVDIVELQPTKNAELQEKWGMDSGSEVHGYLEAELSAYYYRDDDSLICATPEAEALVGEGDPDGERVVSGTRLEARILDVLPAPDGDTSSVVATLHALREQTDADPEVDAVRSALKDLVKKGLVERVRTTVPTFRLAIDRDRIRIETD